MGNWYCSRFLGIQRGRPDVSCLAQTNDGFLWLGYTEGLFRFGDLWIGYLFGGFSDSLQDGSK